MARHALSFGLALSLVSTTFAALTDQRFHYPDQIPYKVDNDPSGRGPQFGYNRCNSTTEGPNSDCQLAMLNSIDDFCLWGPPKPNSSIGDAEAETVAWCSKPGHGTRIIPSGSLTGVQVLKAPSYILFTGHLKQENIDMQTNDEGGELDPHGADERGNPLGGLVYTNGFPSNNGNNNSFQQVIEWHNFMGSNIFCFKICDFSVPNSKPLCNNVYDRTGCAFVAPAAYQDGVFEVCESDNQDPVGVYTTNGVVMTYHQPGEGTPISDLPSVKTPASSKCTTYNSASLYAAAATVSPSNPHSGTSSGTSSATSQTGTGSRVTTTTSPTSKPNASTSTASSSTRSGAAGRRVDVTSLKTVGLGVGPFVAVAASILAGLGAVLAGL